MPSREPLGKTLRRQILLNFGTGVPAGLLFGLSAGMKGLYDLAISAGISATYANLIGTPAALILPMVSRRMRPRGAIAHWLVYLLTLLAITIGGCLLAGVFFVGVGLIPGRLYWPNFLFGVRVAILISAMFGMGAYFFDKLTGKLEDSELAEARALKLAAEARLSALAARVRPHFLFNALNSISALVPEDPAAAEDLIGRLSELLRFTLDADAAALVPLGRELAIVRDYLEIERVRFGDRLRAEVRVPADVEATPVPPLSVQTLVENSVKYAVAARREGGAIEVSASAEDGRVIVRVRDDGPGFAETEVLAGHGIDTLRRRLEVQYGSRAGLALVREREGMAVSLTVPREVAP